MSVVVHGFVPVKNPYRDLSFKEAIGVMRDIQNAIKEVARGPFRPSYCRTTDVRVLMSHVDDLWHFDFVTEGESRILSVFFDIDDTGSDVCPGQKIMFSLGAHGDATTIIHALGRALAKLGQGTEPGYWFQDERETCNAWKFIPHHNQKEQV